MFNMKHSGFESLQHVFRELPKRVQTKVLRDGSNAGATPINKALKQSARSIRLTGMLAKAIGRRRKQYSNTGGKLYMNVIGARVHGFRVPAASIKRRKKKKYPRYGGKKSTVRRKMSGPKFINPVKYFRLVEFGTKFARPVPIYDTTFTAVGPQGMRQMTARMELGLMQEARSLVKVK